MRIATDRALIPAAAESVRFLTVTITAPEAANRKERPAANVGLVLDRSGSMDGRKIEMARDAVAHAIRLLDARDRLSLVVYDNEVDVLLESTTASAEAKALAQKRLAQTGARGNTNLSGGWSRGMDEVARHAANEAETAAAAGTSRVLLLTDGLANNGVTDHDELAKMAAAFRARGIATSTFGLGADFDETLLARLATDGGGHFYFIETPKQIPDFLASELGETLEVVAPEAELIIATGVLAHPAPVPTPAVAAQVVVLNDFPVEQKADGMHVKLGDLVGGQEVTLVVALRWLAPREGELAFVDCRLADRAAKLFPQPMRVEWKAVSAAEDQAQPVSAAVLIAAAELMAARAKSDALAANRHGRFDDAKAMLRTAVANIRALANGIREIEVLAARLEQEQSEYEVQMAPLAMKARHFVSYSQSASRSPEGKAKRRSGS